MRGLPKVVIIIVGLFLWLAPQALAQPAYEADYDYANNPAVDMFYLPLLSYGYWIRHEVYGLVWYPAHVENRWGPYTRGYWVYTDYGWAWESDEPWSWAVYHYGRWFYDDRHGWLWYPGEEWGPAWVVWRYGNGWVGWAPMPPRIIWNADLGLDFTYLEADTFLPYDHFYYVPYADFVRVDIVNIIVIAKHRHDFEHTKIAAHYKKKEDKVINYLPAQEAVEQAVQEPIKQVEIVEAASLDTQGLREEGKIAVFRLERRGKEERIKENRIIRRHQEEAVPVRAEPKERREGQKQIILQGPSSGRGNIRDIPPTLRRIDRQEVLPEQKPIAPVRELERGRGSSESGISGARMPSGNGKKIMIEQEQVQKEGSGSSSGKKEPAITISGGAAKEDNKPGSSNSGKGRGSRRQEKQERKEEERKSGREWDSKDNIRLRQAPGPGSTQPIPKDILEPQLHPSLRIIK